MLPLFDAGYINMSRQYLTIGVNGLVEAAQFMGIDINDNPKYEAFVQEILGMIEKYNKKYRTKEVLFNCEMIPAENGCETREMGQRKPDSRLTANVTTAISIL